MMLYLYHMNSTLSTANERKLVWEDTGLIGPETNCSVSREFGQNAITRSTENDSTRCLCSDIGKVSGIYKIINKVNDKYYVGSSTDIKTRWNNHIKELRQKSHDNKHMERAWHKYGSDNFQFVIIERVPPEQLILAEQKYLDICKAYPKTSYNMAYDAIAPNRGRQVSPETRLKLSISHMGIKHTSESRLKISNSRVGALNPFYGIGPRKAIVAGQLKRQRPVALVDATGNILEMFPSIKIASQKLHLPKGAVYRVCSGEYRHTHGLFFKFCS